MAADPTTSNATRCARCSAVTITPTDPLRILERLPGELFNVKAPDPGIPGAQWEDVFADQAIFGIVPPEDVTPQYELARIIAEEKDRFRLAWAQAEALQLGLGITTVNEDGEVHGQCPHATGEDLDRWCAQFGVGRPSGFGDCCLWRLFQLIRCTPATTRWVVAEIAELFTGLRPEVIEAPALLTLRWPVFVEPETPESPEAGEEFFDDEGFYNDTPFWSAGSVTTSPAEDLEGFWVDGSTSQPVETWWVAETAFPGRPDLEDAINQVKAGGVAVLYENLPLLGSAGCQGATSRGVPIDIRGHWS